MIDSTLASDNSLHFRQNLLERIRKLIMTIDDKIRDEKLQYGINTETRKIALSSGKTDKYEYLTGEEILPPDQSIIEQANVTHSPLVKVLEVEKSNRRPWKKTNSSLQSLKT